MNPGQIVSLIKRNVPSILSGAALIGTGATTYLAYKAGKKYNPNKEFKQQWKNYISTAVAFVGTAACIVGANRLHLKKETALAAAIAFYKAFGEDFENAAFDKFSDAGLRENVMAPNKDQEEPKSMTMKLKIWEPYTRQYFEASQQDILWAELTANKMLQQRGTVTLNDILRLYNDPKIKFKRRGDLLGWSFEDDGFCESSSYYYCGGWTGRVSKGYEDVAAVVRYADAAFRHSAYENAGDSERAAAMKKRMDEAASAVGIYGPELEKIDGLLSR